MRGVSRILITGGSGLLAVNWAISLRDQYNITLALHKRNISLKDVKTSFIDIHTESVIEQFLVSENISTVINAAGITNIEQCEADPVMAGKVNRDCAELIARKCYELGVTFVQISTDHLFSGEQFLVDENNETCPINVYAKTKADAEVLILASNPKALILRTNFFGWGPPYRLSFSDRIIGSLEKGDKIGLFDDVFYTPIIASELAMIAHELVEGGASGVFNVVSDDRVSKFEFGLKIAKTFDLDSRLIEK